MRTALRLLWAGRRSQRGSVLSGVLIITAFIAIISGALMTELSGNLLVSRTLLDRVNNEATDDSAVEVALSQLQAASLNSPCPNGATASVNNTTASTSYLRCWATMRQTQLTAVGGGGSAFPVDGVHGTANGLDDYVVGDNGGTLYDVQFGHASPRWSVSAGTAVTATPLIIPLPGSASQVLDVVPVAGHVCGAENCLNVFLDTPGSTSPPTALCVAPGVDGTIQAQPGASPTQAGLVYFATGPALFATDVSQPSQQQCDFESSATIPNNELLQAQPIALVCTKGSCSGGDYVYTVVGTASATHLLAWTYSKSSLKLVQSYALPWGNVSGVAVSGTTSPVTMAITFGNGEVELAQVSSTGSVSLGAQAPTGTTVSDAPFWCHCPGGDQIGVAGQNGALYLYNSSLQAIATYPAGGSAIITTPAADGAGNWYFGANDGYVHEVQQVQGQANMAQVDTFGQIGHTTSAPVLSSCSIGICIYLGSSNDSAYLVPLDSRRAIISACISTTPPACSGDNPRLWAKVAVGGYLTPQAVHVEGWSYYSG